MDEEHCMDEEQLILRRDKNFPKDATRVLSDTEPLYKSDPIYRIGTDHPHYPDFLEFLVEELDSLPFENEVGETILMRSDAKKVVADLSSNLRNQLRRLRQGRTWDNGIGSLEDYFFRSLEVFKNEIYPRMDICGVGYNLDLGRMGTLDVPQMFILERYYVDARESNPNGFTIKKNGSIEIYFFNGFMRIDLSESRPGGVHLR